MTGKRVLIVYFSRSGTTRVVAEALRDELRCEIDTIAEPEDRRGVVGYLRSLVDALLGRPAQILPRNLSPSDYDLVLIGSPVWNGAVSTPVRAYLRAHREEFAQVAFFCTHTTTGSVRALDEMTELCGQTPVITLDLRRAEVRERTLASKVRSFACALTASSPPASAAKWRRVAVAQALFEARQH